MTSCWGGYCEQLIVSLAIKLQHKKCSNCRPKPRAVDGVCHAALGNAAPVFTSLRTWQVGDLTLDE